MGDILLELLRKNNKGSLTVEAAIIVPVIIMTIVALILYGEFLYQKAYIQSIADRSAQRGAEIWNNPSKDMIMAQITKDRMKDVSLYWRIYGLDFAKSGKESKIEEYAKYLLNKSMIFGKPISVESDAAIAEDYIVYKKIRVTVTARYKNPMGNFLRVFGVPNTIDITANSYAIINEPVEFIRTTDFATDVVKEIDNKVFKGKGQTVVSNVKEAVSNIFTKLRDFMNSKKKEEN